jgi:exonuclease III
MFIVKIASLNINGIRSRTRILMLADFIRKHEIDIALVEEVNHMESLDIRRYMTHFNVGSDMGEQLY